MKKIILINLFLIITGISFGQKQTFDLITYTQPKGWKNEINKELTSYTYIDKKDKSWCQIGIYKSTVSKGNIDADFESEWETLVKKKFHPVDTPNTNMQQAEGWNIKSGACKFLFEEKETAVILTTFSGYGVCISIVATMPNQRYIKNFEELIASVKLKIPEANISHSQNNSQTNGNTTVPSVIGKWSKTSTSNSNSEVSNGLHEYHQMQYEFNPDGTYNFLYRSFSYLPDILIAKENGTYIVKENAITIIPQTSVFETWTKGSIIDGNGKVAYIDKLGKLKSSQKRALEKITYQFTTHYFSGIKEWSLVLQYNKQTVRDGPYNGGSSFSNAWLYGVAKFPIELK